MNRLLGGTHVRSLTRYIALFVLLGFGGGCSTLPPRHPVPVDQLYRAQVLPGVPAVRAWSGSFSEAFESDLIESFRQENENTDPRDTASTPSVNVLILSGGADYGAFGAGFMNGWSQSGTRPEFKFVTGISTGAIIAPFAFLGPEYDRKLKQAFTTVSAEDVYIPRWLSFLWRDAFADTTPLARLIEKYMDQNILLAVAKAHNQGRRLYIGTTNLDVDRLVVWNMGIIANSGHPKALELFRKVILASSSVPVAFPPVLINVDIDDVPYDEMHVDGGVKAQLFLTAATIDVARIRSQFDSQRILNTKRKLFIIRNAPTGPESKPIPRKLAAISERAITSLIKSQARSDLERIYAFALKRDYDFNWVSLANEYVPTEREPFDTATMNRLFKVGYEMGKKDNPWRNVPPRLGQH